MVGARGYRVTFNKVNSQAPKTSVHHRFLILEPTVRPVVSGCPAEVMFLIGTEMDFVSNDVGNEPLGLADTTSNAVSVCFMDSG